MKDEYLGDGVYASFDGYQIWLDTRLQEPVNRIALEARTFHALIAYVKKLEAGDAS
jgi:hypothetical protein